MIPSLAILITYFGEGELIKECLDSILDHPERPDEIFVYDDASLLPARNYIPDTYPVTILRGETNQGPGFGRNVLLHKSQSEYIHFQDADDLFYPGWCEAVKSEIANTNADIVLTDITSMRGDEVVSERVMDLERLTAINDLVKFGLMGSILVPSTTFRRAIALNIGGYRTRETLAQSEDFDFHARLAASGAKFTTIPEPLIIQRLRPDSHSHKNTALCWTSALEAILLLSQDLPGKYLPDLAETATRVGSQLSNLGMYADAKAAFQLARKLGSPKFLHQNRTYQFIATHFGQEIAEASGLLYRNCIPQVIRQQIRQKGLVKHQEYFPERSTPTNVMVK